MEVPDPPGGGNPQFFTAATTPSKVKAAIVADYFSIWANIIVPTTLKWGGDRVGYIDLYAGKGRYDDRTKSTPLLILERAIADPRLREMLVVHLNDGAPEHASSLKANIEALEDYETLRYKPKVYNTQVDRTIERMFAEADLIPSLIFVDPWGYKGVTRPLLKALIKDWGSDVVFFFNFRRINMAISNRSVSTHMEAFFGSERLATLRKRLRRLKREELPKAIREQKRERRRRAVRRRRMVMRAAVEALRELGCKFVLRFFFRNKHGLLTHYLIFMCKHFRGYERMRATMANYSTSVIEGVPSLGYSVKEAQNPSFDLGDRHPIDALKERLLRDLEGRTMRVIQIFEAHSIGKRYLLENYKEALRRLESEERISADPPAATRPTRKGIVTMGDKTTIAFPRA